jgi:hypothetical protein
MEMSIRTQQLLSQNMKVFGWVLALGFLVIQAPSQENYRITPDGERLRIDYSGTGRIHQDHSLRDHQLLFASSMAADLGTTFWGISKRGIREANPIMSNRPAQIAGVGAGITLTLWMASNKLAGRGWCGNKREFTEAKRAEGEKRAKKLLKIASIIHFGAAANNVIVTMSR